MRLDTTTIMAARLGANVPGHFTGSAMPMRLRTLDGTLIDVYKATTQMTDESGQTYPFTSDALLSAAVGPQGYYGAFTVNAHTDSASNPVADGSLSSALSRGIPVVFSAQMLKWLDGRDSSSFGSITWTSNTLTSCHTRERFRRLVASHGSQTFQRRRSLHRYRPERRCGADHRHHQRRRV